MTGYQSDVQVTGGLQVAAGNQGTAVGASVAVASLNNTINAGIKGTGKTVWPMLMWAMLKCML